MLGIKRWARSPLTQRRLDNFKANGRGLWSLWIISFLFVVTLGAEFIANDRPLLISFKGQLYAPVVVDYPEVTFGGVFETSADYTDPYLAELIKSEGWILEPLIPYSFDTIDFNLGRPAPAPPSTRHWLGTDNQGRDVLARLIYGFRLSMLFALALTIVSTVIGVTAGAVQGYFGGVTDLLFQRFIEVWGGLPQLFIIIIVSSIVIPGFWTLLLVLLLFSWTSLVAVVRAEFLRARNFDYVRAAKALGMKDGAIMFKHVLPNAMVATITFLPFILSGAVVALTSLDFLGLGLPPGSASLGELLRQGKENLNAPWLGFTGFFAIAGMLTLLVFVGEAVRDAFDPRKNFA
ncbi:MAG: ABC transporter permease [Candidatus Marinimicrobia bacterium]|nr:ABC transporter permease [Candidatus Neomarinimicrobiota bacterium]